jgi:hypothetical protein
VLGDVLRKAGHPVRAAELAVHALESVEADSTDVRYAVTALLKLGFDVDRIFDLAERHPLRVMWGVFQALCDEQRADVAKQVFDRHMDEFTHSIVSRRSTIRISRRAGDWIALPEFLERLELVSPNSFISLVNCYQIRAELGDSAPPAPVFGHWLSHEKLHKVALADLLDCWYLHRTDAAEEITQVLADYPAAPECVRITQRVGERPVSVIGVHASCTAIPASSGSTPAASISLVPRRSCTKIRLYLLVDAECTHLG